MHQPKQVYRRILRQCARRCMSSNSDEVTQKQAWKYKYNHHYGNNGRLQISAANDALFGPVRRKNNQLKKATKTTTIEEEVVSADDDLESVSDGHWPIKVAAGQSKALSRKTLLQKHDEQSDLDRAISEASAAMSHTADHEIASVTMPEECSEMAYNPSDHPMLNSLKPVMSAQDAAASLLQTIRHTRQSMKQEKDKWSTPHVPSVTKILKETMSEKNRQILQAWEDRMVAQMGRPAFEEMTRQTFARGERLHSIVDTYMQSGSIDWPNPELPKDDVTDNHVMSLAPILDRFGVGYPPLAIESSVVHPQLDYQGYMDCVALYRDPTKPDAKSKLMLIDWKTAGKAKRSIGQTYDNPLQVAAYVGALNHDQRYPVGVDEGMIVVVYNDGSPASLFRITKGRLVKYWSAWLQRLAKYKQIKQMEQMGEL